MSVHNLIWQISDVWTVISNSWNFPLPFALFFGTHAAIIASAAGSTWFCLYSRMFADINVLECLKIKTLIVIVCVCVGAKYVKLCVNFMISFIKNILIEFDLKRTPNWHARRLFNPHSVQTFPKNSTRQPLRHRHPALPHVQIYLSWYRFSAKIWVQNLYVQMTDIWVTVLICTDFQIKQILTQNDIIE